jgi:hypothetical protein
VEKKLNSGPKSNPDAFAATSAGNNTGIRICRKYAGRHITVSSAGIAARSFMFTGIGTAGTAVGSVTLNIAKAVAAMTKEQFRNEKLYQATMHLARKMVDQGILTEQEYREVDEIFLEKYKPVFGSIFTDI